MALNLVLINDVYFKKTPSLGIPLRFWKKKKKKKASKQKQKWIQKCFLSLWSKEKKKQMLREFHYHQEP